MTPTIQKLCVDLYTQGMEPTTSLLRAKSSPKLTLPEAVKAIQWWQQQNKEKLVKATPTLPDEPLPTSVPKVTIAELEQRIINAEVELRELKQALKVLKDSR